MKEIRRIFKESIVNTIAGKRNQPEIEEHFHKNLHDFLKTLLWQEIIKAEKPPANWNSSAYRILRELVLKIKDNENAKLSPFEKSKFTLSDRTIRTFIEKIEYSTDTHMILLWALVNARSNQNLKDNKEQLSRNSITLDDGLGEFIQFYKKKSPNGFKDGRYYDISEQFIIFFKNKYYNPPPPNPEIAEKILDPMLFINKILKSNKTNISIFFIVIYSLALPILSIILNTFCGIEHSLFKSFEIWIGYVCFIFVSINIIDYNVQYRNLIEKIRSEETARLYRVINRIGPIIILFTLAFIISLAIHLLTLHDGIHNWSEQATDKVSFLWYYHLALTTFLLWTMLSFIRNNYLLKPILRKIRLIGDMHSELAYENYEEDSRQLSTLSIYYKRTFFWFGCFILIYLFARIFIVLGVNLNSSFNWQQVMIILIINYFVFGYLYYRRIYEKIIPRFLNQQGAKYSRNFFKKNKIKDDSYSSFTNLFNMHETSDEKLRKESKLWDKLIIGLSVVIILFLEGIIFITFK